MNYCVTLRLKLIRMRKRGFQEGLVSTIYTCVYKPITHSLLDSVPCLTNPLGTMDLQTLVQALGNTLDPALRKQAETFLEEVSRHFLVIIANLVDHCLYMRGSGLALCMVCVAEL